jgi:hypothetical protein
MAFIVGGLVHKHSDAPQPVRLLCARGERTRRAA